MGTLLATDTAQEEPLMRTAIIITATALVLVIGAAPAHAQRRARVPATGMWGLGGSIGAAGPQGAGLQNGLDVAGNLERYLTPRVSIRGQLGASWWDIEGHSFTGTVTPF